MGLAVFYFVGIHFRHSDAADEQDKVVSGDERQDEFDKEPVKKKHEQYLTQMRERVASVKVRVLGAESDGEFIAEPLMRFSNQAARTADGTLWGWTSQGRLLGVCKIVRMERLFPHESHGCIVSLRCLQTGSNLSSQMTADIWRKSPESN